MPTNAPVAGPESIVTSLHWSRQLLDAGEWPQLYAEFYWVKREGEWIVLHKSSVHFENDEFVPARTAEEILRRLPNWLVQEGQINITKMADGGCNIHYGLGPVRKDGVPSIVQDTLTNATADMYCYLAENGLLPKA